MGAWTGRELVIAGGFAGFPSGGNVFRNGAAYNPATGTWRRLPPMPQRRGGGTAVWDGKDVVFLGGTQPGSTQPSLRPMAYNPQANRWRLLPVMQFRREGFAAVWTGRHILVWGGLSGHPGAWVIPPHGEAYDPAANRWTALPASPLQGRMGAAAAWTGKRMIIWCGYVPGRGGVTAKAYVNGAAFTPRTP
jgi:Kelch motif